MGGYRAPVTGLRCAGFVAFAGALALVDCGGTVITREPERNDDAGAGASSGTGAASGTGGAKAVGGAGGRSGFGAGGRAGSGVGSGGRPPDVDASIGGSSVGGAAGSGSPDAGFCSCPFGYKCLASSQGPQCVLDCPEDRPDVCSSTCTNVKTDFVNCGACSVDCGLQTRDAICDNGACRVIECLQGYGDCNRTPGCETRLDEPENCGACGNKMCRYDHAETACTSEVGCSAPTCEPGWGNCDKASPDCETALGANGATCLPAYDDSTTVPMSESGPTIGNGAVAGDGTVFIGGLFSGAHDFDPGPGTDLHGSESTAGSFVTKLGADGKYGWTRIFEGGGDTFTTAFSAGPDRTIIVAGGYTGTVDFDPGAGVNSHTAPGHEAYVMKLLADGSLAWVRTFTVSADDAYGDVQLSAAGANGSVLLAGSYSGTIDLDPGPGQHLVSSLGGGLFVVQLTASGDFVWGNAVPDCARLAAVALGPDGSARLSGGFSSNCSFDPAGGTQIVPVGIDAFVASFAPGGAYKGVKTFGGTLADVEPAALTVGPDGTTFLAGSFTGKADFDPGPGKAERVPVATSTTTGFVVALKADGGFAWVHTPPNTYIGSVAALPGGGVIAAANFNAADYSGRMLGFGSDGSSTWTLGLPSGPSLSVAFVAANATGFSVLGVFDGTVDLDPGPGTHVFGRSGETTLFTSRYGL
jgi:hypothetical protein